MSNYKSQYENYYSGIRGKSRNITHQDSIEYLANHGSGKRRKKRLSYGTLLIFQCIGSLLILLIFIGFKVAPGERAKQAFVASKNMISENQVDTSKLKEIDFSNLKEVAVKYVDKLRALVGGDEFLKEKLKGEYLAPVMGKTEKTIGEGIFIYTNEGANVMASFNGKVKEVENDKGGTTVVINHGEGIETYYGLLKESQLKEGDEVKKGQVLGAVGKLLPKESYGIEFRLIYMGDEKLPLDYMDFKETLN
ncbi:MAG: peptidoglycan DD-metalloendopeptidase family protein [Clostridium sp.]